ncbi:MAG: hypothetical protein OXI22_18715 [Defluviicoccus sp.]|nr:hypothetical protein [Defluviicoccus sp.]MDE0385922.1 hypothetical protein [Defluviicoccus sp.]
MPNIAKSKEAKLSALIAEIESAAYERGKEDAKKEILDLLGSGGAQLTRARATRGRPPKKAEPKARRASGRKRAPKGSVPRFVEQALSDQPGLTPPEILARAATDMERLIKLPSIRTELRNGGKQGKYESNDGRWSLAGSGSASGEAGSSAASPGSESGGGEGGGTASSTW